MAKFFQSMKDFSGFQGDPGETAIIHLTSEEQAAREKTRREEAKIVRPRSESPVKTEFLPINPELAARQRQEEAIKGVLNATTTADFIKQLVLIDFGHLSRETARALQLKMTNLPDAGNAQAMSRDEMKAMRALDEKTAG